MFELHVSIDKQKMVVYQDGTIEKCYPVSTGKNGAGEIYGSEKTPRGWHCVRAKVGRGAAANTVFVGRRATGEIYKPELSKQYPGRDWILTRIFWLSGLEPGKNRFGVTDTFKRYIYIHGTPDETQLGKPGSRGCIRMANHDIIELFNIISTGTRILIE